MRGAYGFFVIVEGILVYNTRQNVFSDCKTARCLFGEGKLVIEEKADTAQEWETVATFGPGHIEVVKWTTADWESKQRTTVLDVFITE